MRRAGTASAMAFAQRFASLTGLLMFSVCLLALALGAMLPLTSAQQWVFGGCLIGVALWLDRTSGSYLATLVMILLSCFTTFRYAVWRYSTLASYLRYPSLQRMPMDIVFMSVLALAELYTIAVLYLGYFQTVCPLPRKPVQMPEDVDLWPHVDVLVPTYNEPLELVRYTVLAALNMDWPIEKLHVFLLDDGRRPEFRQFAERANVGYVTRADNKGAKAGNINHALRNTQAPFVAIFDCDHVPVRSFLQVTMGWFFRDPKTALVQTPHHFYSPDPFERTLKQFREVPNEGQLFYGIVQVCNDFWNASFFCGSCAVIRRQALDEVGGIATETVTEDAHTSLRMQMAGWNTAYLNTPQAAGLATERLSGHVKQRIRWARGMVQVLRRENPLMAPELSGAQRLCYFNAMMHFLYALPRLVFLTAPLVYLIFGYKVLPGAWGMVLAFALPHILLAQITNSRIQGEHRHSFWNEVYETVLAPYILIPTLLALLHTKTGKFDVTDKGGVVEESYFDTRMAQPFFALLLFLLLGLCMVPLRLLYLDPMHPGTVLINGAWDLLSIVVVGVAIGVSYESQQRRESIRIAMRTAARIVMPDGAWFEGATVDLSAGGSAIHLHEPLPFSQTGEVEVVLPLPAGGSVSLPAQIVGGGGRVVRVQFKQLTITQERKLVGVLFSRANAWTDWGDNTSHDSLLRSFALIVKLSFGGLQQALRSLASTLLHTDRKGGEADAPVAAAAVRSTIVVMLGMAMLAPLGSPRCMAQNAVRSHSQTASPATKQSPAGARDQNGIGAERNSSRAPDRTLANQDAGTPTFATTYTLADLGASGPLQLHGASSERTLQFVLPQDRVADHAVLHVRYIVSPALLPALSHINVMLNDTLFASLPMTAADRTGMAAAPATGGNQVLEQTVALPAELLVHRNRITFQLIGHYTITQCEDPANTAIWAQIDPETMLQVAGNRMAMADDLSLLPLPFFDAYRAAQPKVSIVFLHNPTRKEMEAAGVVASWMGVMADYRRVRFSVHVGEIPPGNAIVFGASDAGPAAENGQTSGRGPAVSSAAPLLAAPTTLAQFGLAQVDHATLAMRTNPNDPFGKVLIVAGKDGAQLLAAAQALATDPGGLAGNTARVSVQLPALRRADDAPRWLDTERPALLGQMQLRGLESDGSAPVDTYLRTAPDLYYGLRRNLRLHLSYRYNPVPLAPHAHLAVSINEGYAASIPLRAGERASAEKNIVLAIPTEDMAPSANTLGMDFFLPIAKSGPCNDGMLAQPRASVLPDSYLDLKGIPHWAALPNLQLFSNAGFPFTRMADLSQSTVIVPERPSTAEIELLLTLLAHMGAETGYPALRLNVGAPSDLGSIADRDYLVLGTPNDQPAFDKLAPNLPVALTLHGIRVHSTDAMYVPVQELWWRIQGRPTPQGGRLKISGTVPAAMLEALESPYQPGRSVVAVMVRDDAQVGPFLAAFGETVNTSAIAQSVSILHGGTFDSYRLGTSFYHVGKLPLWDLLSVELAAFPYLGALLLLFACCIMALIGQGWLRRRAARRLQDRSIQGDAERRDTDGPA
jgi:cellulose synthase (UDP-forming)